MSVVWSCGGGTQSAGIAALIVTGELPKPDMAVIADTGREAESTWAYCESTLRPKLADVGVELHIAPHSLATVDLWSGKAGETLVMPAFTAGGVGQLPKFCSTEWKTRVIDRYCRQHGISGGTQWIGFSLDEVTRVRAHRPGQKWRHEYPLIDRRMRRHDVVSMVVGMGWPLPPRSRCWCCPYQTNQEWRSLSKSDMEKAVSLDKEIRRTDGNAYLYRGGRPLGGVDFADNQPGLFACDSGHCFT